MFKTTCPKWLKGFFLCLSKMGFFLPKFLVKKLRNFSNDGSLVVKVDNLHDCCELGMIVLFHPDHTPLLLVDNCIRSNYVFDNNLWFFDQCIRCINRSLNIYSKLMSYQYLINGDFLTINNCLNLSILFRLPSVQKFLQQVCLWNYQTNN